MLKNFSECRSQRPALLVFADGTIFPGIAFGALHADGASYGEAVFSTGMTGYQETMTDPSYHKQLVILTAPQIGNTGWNDDDNESRENTIWVAGLIIRDLSRIPSNWRSRRSLEEEMIAQNISGIRGVDTRTVVRHVRKYGSIAAGLFTDDAALRPPEELIQLVAQQPSMSGADLTEDVTTHTPYTLVANNSADNLTVVCYDMGVKTNTLRNFHKRGINTVVVPASTPYKEITTYSPDGVFVSNGPGDPATANTIVNTVREILAADIPFFGICFGNQILGRALGMDTYKLKFGHRGINVPVKDHRDGHIEITAQNHGFALRAPTGVTPGDIFDTPFGAARITHTCLNDGVIEGIELCTGRAFSVQYHPEAAAGPHDANHLFDQFVELMKSSQTPSLVP